MPTRAVILDFDGVVADSEPVHLRSFEMFLARYGIQHHFTDDEFARLFVGIPVAGNAEYLIRQFGLALSVPEIVREREQIYRELLKEPGNLAPISGLTALLDAVQARGIALAVASGSPRDQVETVLRGMGLISRFRVIVTASDVPRNKPAPDVYLRAVQLLGLPTTECLAVEDSATGVAAAQAAGLRVIAVPNRFTRHQDLSRADARVENLGQVIQWMESGL